MYAPAALAACTTDPDALTQRYAKLINAARAGLPKDALVVLHCHHGVRSRSVAEKLLQDGFRNVHNLTGGIDAWSAEVDPSVPRY